MSSSFDTEAFLASDHKHPRDADITFKDDGHVYTMKGSTDNISVTTLISQYFSKFQPELMSKLVARSILKNFDEAKHTQYIPLLVEDISEAELADKIQKHWNNKGTEAANDGTALHLAIENYLLRKPVDPVIKATAEFTKFLIWYSGSGLLPYRCEWLVYDEDYRICGAIDCVMYEPSTGKYHIKDWKRSKAINYKGYRGRRGKGIMAHLQDCNYSKYSLQLNTYKYILAQKYDIIIDSMALVVLHPNFDEALEIQIPDLQDEVAAIFSTRRVQLEKPTTTITTTTTTTKRKLADCGFAITQQQQQQQQQQSRTLEDYGFNPRTTAQAAEKKRKLEDCGFLVA